MRITLHALQEVQAKLFAIEANSLTQLIADFVTADSELHIVCLLIWNLKFFLRNRMTEPILSGHALWSGIISNIHLARENC